MPKDDQEESLDKVLTANLARAIDFLKFAETKNAAILTFDSAWILALSNFVLNSDNLWIGFSYTVPFTILVLLISVVIALVSFLPRTKVSYFYGSNHRPANLLFVGDIEGLSAPDLKDRFVLRYSPSEGRTITADYLSDLTQQISIVSNIAMSKFRSFNRSAILTLVALLISAIPVLVRIYLIASTRSIVRVS